MARKGRSGLCFIFKKKIENRNSAGIPEGNHKTIRAALGCSERAEGQAGSQNPCPNCALHPGAPDRSRIEPRFPQGKTGPEQTTGKEADVREEDEGEQYRQVRSGAGSPRRGRRPWSPRPVQFRALESLPVPHSPRSPHHVQIFKKKKNEPLRRSPRLAFSNTESPHWGRHGSKEATASDSKNPDALSQSHADWRALSTSF